MKKKLLLALSLVAIMTVLFAISVSAAEPVETWDVSATSNDSVAAYLYADPNNSGKYTLTISGTGNMKKWDYYYSVPWYSSYSSKITSVTIENGVTSIGEYAFCHCESLTSVVIPDSVTSIGNSAFTWCKSLTSVAIPESVTSIGDYAFYRCTSLTSVVIGESVIRIGYAAFCLCTSLTSVVIPDGVISIGSSAFRYCDSLTIYCEAQSQPSGWISSWNPDRRPVVWDYKNTMQNDIFTFKGYSIGFAGQISVGYDIDYKALAKYEEKTGKTLEIGVVFAGYENLGGKQPLDENGQAIELSVGRVSKADLTSFNYPSYDFVLTDIVDSIKDVKLVIAAYIFDGENVKYVQENGLSDTVSGISYNEAKIQIDD